MNDYTPHLLVSLIALGMAVAFLSADRDSRTSRALAAALSLIGISIFLNVVVFHDGARLGWWSGLLAIPESLASICVLEWLLRVRRTVPAAPGMNVAAGDRLLRVGQVISVLYTVLALIWPDVRLREFIRAGENPQAFLGWGFWLFAAPLLLASLTGLAGILLLLNRKPDLA
ncbi:MAG TPA: adenylate/guanylate cyclase domain-containing protein, partial [Solimonas sp.]|nr:adenylate/guanylate cyclase domain-containing protein [Solimonas sp.]